LILNGEATMAKEKEINVSIDPKKKVLKSLGVTLEEFETALRKALDLYDNKRNRSIPVFELPVILKSKTYRLEQVAEITGDV
jgi:hypothetical protein